MASVAEQGLGVEDDSMLASKTTVAGNEKAKDSLQRTTKSVGRLATVLKKDSKKIFHLGDAFNAVQNAAQKYADKFGYTRGQDIIVNVNGFNITVRGNVVDGVFRIGTFFIP